MSFGESETWEVLSSGSTSRSISSERWETVDDEEMHNISQTLAGVSVADLSELSEIDRSSDTESWMTDSSSVHSRTTVDMPVVRLARRKPHRRHRQLRVDYFSTTGVEDHSRNFRNPSRRKQRRHENDRLEGIPDALKTEPALLTMIPECSSAIFDELMSDSRTLVRNRFLSGYSTLRCR